MAAAFNDTASSAEKLLSNIQVTLRPKPSCRSTEHTGTPSDSETKRHGSIVSRVAGDNPSKINMVHMDDEFFLFDHLVWADEPQERVYRAAAHPLVEKTLQGYNATIIAFGAAQTGKSYTMGTLVPMMSDDPTSGLVQRCLKHIFEQPKIRVSASVVEIFNEKLYDLLNDGAKLKVCGGTASDPGIERIRSLENGFEMFNKALELRREDSDSTAQSHVSLTLHLRIKNGGKFLESKLKLIDLAGSRIEEPTGAENEGLAESLSALMRVMHKMTKITESSKNILHKNSVLTSILEDSLDAKSLISLVACVSLQPDDHKKNLRTLQLAEFARTVKIEPQLRVTSGNIRDRSTSGNNRDGSNSPSKKRWAVLTPISAQAKATDTKLRSDTAIELSTKLNMKNCCVVLKRSEADFYENNKELHESKENVETTNRNGRDQRNQNISMSNNRATSPSGTHSTVSISSLETPNGDHKTSPGTIVYGSEWFDPMWTSLDESFSISPVKYKPLDSSKKNDIGNNGTSEDVEFYLTCSCPFECSLTDAQPANDLVHGLEPLTDETTKKPSLADNISQLSICSVEETASPECQGAEASSRLTCVAIDDLKPLENLDTFHGFQVVNLRKRPSATLTIDPSEPGPSGTGGCRIPRKTQKLGENNPSLKVDRVQDSQEFENSGLKEDNDFNNIVNKRKELREKQKVHNEYILAILNSCDVKGLQILPRIGAKTAMSIYQYRLIHGEYKSFEDLKYLPIWSLPRFNQFLMANNVVLE